MIYEAVGLVKLMSYAIPTSPDEVNSAGREVLKDVFETEKMLEPLLMSRNFPEVIEVEDRYNSVPVVRALSIKAKAEVVVVPVTTLEVNV